MVKKILKNLMQKPKHTPMYKEKSQTRKKKSVPKYPQKKENQLDIINKKIESIKIQDQSETQPSQPTSLTKSIIKKKTVKKTPQNSPKRSVNNQTKTIEDEGLVAQYKKFLTILCAIHSANYHKNSIKEHPVTLQWYKKLKSVWKSDNQDKPENQKLISKSKPVKDNIIKKTEKILDVQNITVELIKRLKPKHWLNDEVINSYIQLIEIDSLKKNPPIKNEGFSICLVKTYFAALKMTPQRIEREINKRGLSSKTLLIIPINEDFHWFFLMIFDQKIYIFDSILPKPFKTDKEINLSKKSYSMKDSVKKCIKLYEKMYKLEQMDLNQMVVVRQFPQQDNANDCGMMMLCGIKNVISRFQTLKRQEQIKKFGQMIQGKEFWTFCIQDIRYLRFMFGRQLLQESLIIE